MGILEPGHYFIVNKADESKVGLAPLASTSTRWAILRAPSDVEDTKSVWAVGHIEGHLYRLVVDNSLIAISEGGKVFGDEGGNDQWTITQREGAEGYTIEDAKRPGVGWVLPHDDPQV
ncbi:hypothetical protein H0H81_008675 [Sphagnurus paluster]|uniref:Uncharacterized protein n=1 Tax=Sphagnurus paluster TaxID=117069 RepID=A0A9P7FSH9_9AGAR|nr:hypothetical protein H0H81_008675 [Sphagnurus paluster]